MGEERIHWKEGEERFGGREKWMGKTEKKTGILVGGGGGSRRD